MTSYPAIEVPTDTRSRDVPIPNGSQVPEVPRHVSE
jgi:hypothetical protein